jgi:transposase InsO family protein
VTAVFTGAGWLYLAAILDLFSRAVVGWETSSTNDTELALSALDVAVRKRNPPPAGLIHSLRSRNSLDAQGRAAQATASRGCANDVARRYRSSYAHAVGG